MTTRAFIKSIMREGRPTKAVKLIPKVAGAVDFHPEELAELKDWAEPGEGLLEVDGGWARATVRKLIRYVEARLKADRERELSPLPSLSAIDCSDWPDDARDAFVQTSEALKVANLALSRRGSWEELVAQLILSERPRAHRDGPADVDAAHMAAIRIVAALEGRTA